MSATENQTGWKWQIPEALADEDGETWYLQGHVDPPLAVLAVVMEQVTNGCEPIEVLAGGDQYVLRPGGREVTYRHCWEEQRDYADNLLGSVQHVWLRQRPDNEELMDRVDADTEGAEPWTWVTCR